jgi:hypothetical protein
VSNAWDHLPNAKHIDATIASAKAHPKEWSAAYYAVRNVSRDAEWVAARCAAWDAVGGAARDAAVGATYYAAWDAVSALVAYDDCAYMLDSAPSELEILAKFGDERAILLLSACKAFAAIKETT